MLAMCILRKTCFNESRIVAKVWPLNKICKWFHKFKCVRFESFSYDNQVAIETWIRSTIVDQIYACIIVFIHNVFLPVIQFSDNLQ